MGIASAFAFSIYVLVAFGVYKIIQIITPKKIVRGVVIVFFILLPTYDIIISSILRSYYCNFTEMKRVNKKIERPEVVLYEEEHPFSKYKYAVNEARSYLYYVKAIQIKTRNGGVHEFRAKEYTKPVKRENVFEVVKEQRKKVDLTIKRESLIFPWFVKEFLHGQKIEIINTDTNKVIAWSKRINHKKYNFIFIDTGYFLRGKSCGGTVVGWSFLEQIIKGEKDAK